ncbi:MAG TPA: SRPBCC family protein [Candidatus Xenobia bacterium]|nr:SRPBCC family protein [Candidatus Xenobia bacterium]
MPKEKRTAVVESLAVLAPPERVWAALTSPRELGLLLLGRVEMGSAPGAPFSWQWGVWERVAPGRTADFRWTGKVLDVVPGSTLVLGPSPVVCFTVQGRGDSTLMTVTQGVSSQEQQEYEYGWADFLLRLKTQLETEHLERQVMARALLRAKPHQVYRAWLSPSALARIIPGKAKVAAKPGGRFTWQHKRGKHQHSGVFLDLKKDRALSFTWEGTHPPSEVRIEGQPTPYGTLVAVHHTSLVAMNRGQLFAQRVYWMRLLERMRCYFYFKGKIKSAD